MILKNLLHISIFIGLSLVSITMGTGVHAQSTIPPKPKTETSVYDQADMLSDVEEKALEQKLIRYSDTTSTQIVVATIKSLQGEYIGLYAAEWAQEWGIGQKKEDNGIFVLVARDDRKIFIAPGYGVEDKLTDFTTKTIIDQIITPEFKNGNYYRGLDKGSTAIFEVLNGTFKGSRKRDTPDFPIGQAVMLLIVFVIIFISMTKGNKGGKGGNRGNRSGGSLLDVIILSNMGRGGFGSGSGGGSFGGGGFGGGFGGGGFGGGGAGGSW